MAEKDPTYEYISALQDFNKSVEYLIKFLETSSKQSKDTKSTIADNAEYFRNMSEMAEKLEVVVENTSKTKDNTDKILKVVEGLKKEKKKGIWDRLSSKDKTKDVGEGIKTIALMAGSILAIGSAFKIIGEVDFESVIALSIALPLMAEAFNRMDKSLSPKDAAVLSANMIIMSVGVAASGYILSMMPELGFKQMISVVGVAVGMGVAMYAMAMTADMLNTKEVGNMFLLAAVMPAMALGIAISGSILADMPEVPFMKTVETTAAVSLSIGMAGLVIAGLSYLNVGIKDALIGSLAMTIISGGLMASSWILSAGSYDTYPTLEWSSGVGLALIASIPVVLAYGALAATGIGAVVIGAGIVSMLGVAGGLVGVSHILKDGDYSGGPTKEWSEGVGLALMSFTNALSMIEPGPMDLLFGESMDSRIHDIIQIGGALKDVSFVIQGGSYKGGPSKEWSEGVGLALVHFSNALNQIEPSFLEKWVFGESIDQQIESMVKLGSALYRIGLAVGSDNSVYKGGPDKRWAEGVGGSILAFSSALDAAEGGIFSSSIDERLLNMVKLAKILPILGRAVGSDTSMYQGGPDERWAKGVGAFLETFSGLEINDDPADTADGIIQLAKSYLTLAGSLSVLGKSTQGIILPDFSSLYGGIVTLSLVDDDRLEDVLDVLDDKKDKFASVFSAIKATSEVKIDDSTFAFNKDKKSTEKTTPSTSTKTSSAISQQTPISIKTSTTPAQTKESKDSQTLQKIYDILYQMNGGIDEIADNTSKSLSDSGNIISN